MKKILVVILIVIFFIGVYMNFGSGNPIDQLSLNTSNDNTQEDSPDESGQDTGEDSSEEDTSGENSSENENDAPLVFSQPALNDKYEAVSNNNEPLIIDILLPEYYSDDFETRLAAQFDTNTVQFNRQTLNVNSTDLSEVSISDNSDAVIIDALQIQDYNDEVLFDRNNNNLTDVYMSIFNSDRVAYILGNPNAHEHENLANVLSEDASYFSDNDYYYIDNQETEGSYDADTDQLSTESEDAVIQSIYNYLID